MIHRTLLKLWVMIPPRSTLVDFTIFLSLFFDSILLVLNVCEGCMWVCVCLCGPVCVCVGGSSVQMIKESRRQSWISLELKLQIAGRQILDGGAGALTLILSKSSQCS